MARALSKQELSGDQTWSKNVVVISDHTVTNKIHYKPSYSVDNSVLLQINSTLFFGLLVVSWGPCLVVMMQTVTSFVCHDDFQLAVTLSLGRVILAKGDQLFLDALQSRSIPDTETLPQNFLPNLACLYIKTNNLYNMPVRAGFEQIICHLGCSTNKSFASAGGYKLYLILWGRYWVAYQSR